MEKYLRSLNIILVGQTLTFWRNPKINLNFVDFLSSDISTQFFLESKLSIHSETGNIYYDGLNTNKSIFDFFRQKQDKTKKFLTGILSYGRTFPFYIKEFLDDIDSKTADRYDILTNKNVKHLFYRCNVFVISRNIPSVFVRPSKITENKIVLEELKTQVCNIL